MSSDVLTTQVLVVGGGTGGTAAAIQAARRGAQVTLVSEFPWLGGMLTSAGVSVPDGNELVAFQTGLWGAFLRELRQRQPQGLDHAWVSFFSFDPRLGARIFADWVAALPNLRWIQGQRPRAVRCQGDRLCAVRFDHCTVEADLILDATELGDLLALGDVSYRWGWESQELWQEPSAPTQVQLDGEPVCRRYPVQSPTWVVYLEDYGEEKAPVIVSPLAHPPNFEGAWESWSDAQFLDYGRLPGGRFMLNWPGIGNDYGEGLDRLLGSDASRQAYGQEAIAHSLAFAAHVQQRLGRRYGLARGVFPTGSGLGGGALALHPYFRESRRLEALRTVTETDILPRPGAVVAALPTNGRGEVSAIALGNYPNDHHYPGFDYRLAPKSLRWGGRWTGTPFTIPYEALVPVAVEGLLVCEKNIGVSHMANGATRLQPVVLGLGQAAGMAAALCVQRGCQPRDLPVRDLQEALIADPQAPAAVIPLFDADPRRPDWADLQRQYLDHPDTYPADGCHGGAIAAPAVDLPTLSGQFRRLGEQDYRLETPTGAWQLVTLRAEVNAGLAALADGQPLSLQGRTNPAGNWLLVESL